MSAIKVNYLKNGGSTGNNIALNADGSTTVESPIANGSVGVRNITISTSAPSGGSDGDVWLRYAT